MYPAELLLGRSLGRCRRRGQYLGRPGPSAHRCYRSLAMARSRYAQGSSEIWLPLVDALRTMLVKPPDALGEAPPQKRLVAPPAPGL